MSLLKIYASLITLNTLLTLVICFIAILLSALFARTKTAEGQDNFAFVSNIWIGTRTGIASSLLLLWLPLVLAMSLHAPIRSLAALRPLS